MSFIPRAGLHALTLFIISHTVEYTALDKLGNEKCLKLWAECCCAELTVFFFLKVRLNTVTGVWPSSVEKSKCVFCVHL